MHFSSRAIQTRSVKWSNLHAQIEVYFSVYFFKNCIMKLTLHLKLPATIISFALIGLFGCNGTSSDDKKAPDTTAADEHPRSEAALSDNQVKVEAPDGNSKTDQGYGLARHSDKMAQSPIDIVSSKANKSGKEMVSFVFHSDIEAAQNLGHTIELECKDGSTCILNGKVYISKQFHFHTPSEHMVDGMTFPLEMHMVNSFKDSAGQMHNLVVAILFKIGSENAFLKEFLDKIPAKDGEKSELEAGGVKLADLTPEFTESGAKSCFTYDGSLTTPPYSENVHWVVMKHIVEASEDQIATIEKLEGNNARHVQAVNDRIVYSH
jgi:carbonic anhydrase